jgi:hypothetical protein
MTIKEWKMRRIIMSLMIKTWKNKVTKILSLRAGKTTAISSLETTQPRRTLGKAKRRNKNFLV